MAFRLSRAEEHGASFAIARPPPPPKAGLVFFILTPAVLALRFVGVGVCGVHFRSQFASFGFPDGTREVAERGRVCRGGGGGVDSARLRPK